jgi:hypothetical protein
MAINHTTPNAGFALNTAFASKVVGLPQKGVGSRELE